MIYAQLDGAASAQAIYKQAQVTAVSRFLNLASLIILNNYRLTMRRWRKLEMPLLCREQKQKRRNTIIEIIYAITADSLSILNFFLMCMCVCANLKTTFKTQWKSQKVWDSQPALAQCVANNTVADSCIISLLAAS